MDFKQEKPINLNLISETIDLMNKAENFQVVSKIIFNFIENFVNYNMAVIYRLNEKEESLEMVSCIGSDAEKMRQRMPLKIAESAVGLVVKDKRNILINDVLNSKEIIVRQYSDEDPIIRSFLAVPLILGDKIIGILSVSSSKPHEYSQYDVQMIGIIAAQGAALMELNANVTEAKNFTNQILENVNSGVIVINDKYEIITFNKAAETIMGYSLEEVLGKNIISLPLKEEGDEWAIVQSMRTGKVLFEKEGLLLRRDGTEVRIRLSTSLIYDENQELKSCTCIFRDTTEIEELQKQIAMAEKLAALGRITSGITHEIRNPLLPIRNASEYLLNKYLNQEEEKNEDVVNLLRIIREESERLNRFLEQLVTLNKDSFFSRGKCNLSKALEEILVLLKYGFNENNISLNIEDFSQEVYVGVNEDNLKQIFLNTLLNSIDAIKLSDKKEKEINVEFKEEKDFINLTIEDTGQGISSEELGKVFDPFYTTKDSGTGIGLPTIRNIIKNSGGELSIESKLGIGTRVILLLPKIN